LIANDLLGDCRAFDSPALISRSENDCITSLTRRMQFDVSNWRRGNVGVACDINGRLRSPPGRRDLLWSAAFDR
jgi:hypothetical protein